MKCPRCNKGTLKRRYSQSRGATAGYQPRSRVCANCGERFATYELVVPTVKGAMAVQFNQVIRSIVQLTLEQHTLQKIGGTSEQAVQIRRGVSTAWGLKMLLKKRMKNGKLNSLFRFQV